MLRGTGVAQLGEHLTLDFGSGHVLTVCEFESCVGFCAGCVESVWDSLSPSLSAPPPLALALSLSKINKHYNKMQ